MKLFCFVQGEELGVKMRQLSSEMMAQTHELSFALTIFAVVVLVSQRYLKPKLCRFLWFVDERLDFFLQIGKLTKCPCTKLG
jgi:hypothetical protein